MRTICLRIALIFALFSAFALGLSSLPAAQEKQSKAAKREMTVTGCLQQGDEAGKYSITSTDGKLYRLRSKIISLSEFVGYKVTVTGTQMREESEEKKKKESGRAEYADLWVNSLKKTSESLGASCH